jgi:hypothetical protein
MAKVIEFYVPAGFPKIAKWIPPEQRGKIIQFRRERRSRRVFRGWRGQLSPLVLNLALPPALNESGL